MTDYPTCSTCKHWDPEDNYGPAAHGRRICSRIPAVRPYDEPETEPAVSYYDDGGFATLPTFGCLLQSALTSQ